MISRWELFQDLISSIEYLGGYSLHTLVIEDVSSGSFLELLCDLYSPPKFLTALELSGKLVQLPVWITELDALTKLTLSVTALSSDALVKISNLKTLFSLTFSLAAQKQDPETAAIVEENKENSNGEIIFLAGGFENLKLLRFSAPFVPLLRFSRDAMPKLERLEVRFSILDGLYGVENLSALKEVHLRVHDEACEFTELMVEGMKTAVKKGDGGPRVITDRYHD
jgi:disease resistance protein RPM1